MAELYTYAVARTKAHECTLLGNAEIQQLMSCKTYDDCMRILHDKGWGNGSGSSEEILSAELQKTWNFIGELMPDLSVFNVLRYPADFNNLKAAIKGSVSGAPMNRVFMSGGTTSPKQMLTAVQKNDFSILPPVLGIPAQRAYQTLLQSRDGQLCDIILDRACLEAISSEGEQSENDFIREYARTTVALADIRIAVRSAKTGKNRAFLQEAIAPCNVLNTQSLIASACKGKDAILNYLFGTDYSDAVPYLKESFSAFEKWGDNRIVSLTQSQKHNSFTIGPLAAYILARQNEISAVRIILSGKLNHLNDSIIQERLREMYV